MMDPNIDKRGAENAQRICRGVIAQARFEIKEREEQIARMLKKSQAYGRRITQLEKEGRK